MEPGNSNKLIKSSNSRYGLQVDHNEWVADLTVPYND